jgi:regulator of nucleoside diphosphate kinase
VQFCNRNILAHRFSRFAALLQSIALPEILINSDDYNRVMVLAERTVDTMPYVSAYLERELKRAAVCDPWDPAGVSMGQRVMFRLDDEGQVRLGRLTYPNRPIGERGNVPILGPVGAALIGMRRNSSIEWLDDGRLRTLTVLDYGW